VSPGGGGNGQLIIFNLHNIPVLVNADLQYNSRIYK
jgi:hypothetical protein